jgi:hypothetical protein
VCVRHGQSSMCEVAMAFFNTYLSFTCQQTRFSSFLFFINDERDDPLYKYQCITRSPQRATSSVVRHISHHLLSAPNLLRLEMAVTTPPLTRHGRHHHHPPGGAGRASTQRVRLDGRAPRYLWQQRLSDFIHTLLRARGR